MDVQKWQEYGIKKCEGSEILPHMQINKVARRSFLNAGRKHETPGPETKGFITHSAIGHVSFTFSLILQAPQFPQASQVDEYCADMSHGETPS